MKRKEVTEQQPTLPEVEVRPLEWVGVRVYPDSLGVDFASYVSFRALTRAEADKLHREAKLPALKAAREVIDKEIARLEADDAA